MFIPSHIYYEVEHHVLSFFVPTILLISNSPHSYYYHFPAFEHSDSDSSIPHPCHVYSDFYKTFVPTRFHSCPC